MRATELTFAERYRHDIIHGHKDTTIRLSGQYTDLYPGEPFAMVTPDGEDFAAGYATTITRALAHDATAVVDNLNGHHGCESTRDLVRTLNTFYDEDVTAASEVDIIHFRLMDVMG
jgi:hypothetical protein